ncbi:MAG TPA: hypothetical protein VMG12_11485 [Polyangiaceae bacterium]|nr:hypothetical protein [Polyangiaceae bacterium]
MGRATASAGAVIASLAAAALLGAATPALGAAAPALGAALPSDPAPSRLEFSWNAPASCPDRQMVLEQLEAVLDEHRGELDSAAVRGDIVQSGAAWVLSLDVQVGQARRVRRLSAESCDDLGKAAAVALGLLIRPLSEANRSEAVDTAPAPEPAAAPAPLDAENAALDAVSPPENEPVPLAWQLGAEGVVDAATLAGPALGASVQTGVRVAAWGFGAYGLVLPARRHEVLGGNVEFEQWALGLRACHRLWASDWSLDGCVGAELGRFVGSGRGLNRRRNEVSDPWLASSAGLQLGWHALPHAALVGRVEAVVPLLRENYVINGDDAVHETPLVTGRVSVGLEFDLL